MFGLVFVVISYQIINKIHNMSINDVISTSSHVIQQYSKEKCKEILPCLTRGKWTLRDGLSVEDIEKRTDMDEFLLEYQGWPRKLTRPDGRCGKNYPVNPDVKSTAICEPNSDKPCCNEVKQACGNTPEDCNCELCTNFTIYLPAEISEWNNLDEECRIKNLDHTDACELFQNHISEMVFVGDSLTRHFFVALVLLLTNNFATGALNPKADAKQRENCQGELQFIDRGKYNCHGFIAHRWEELQNVCGGKAKFKVSLEEAYCYERFPDAEKVVKSLLNKSGAVVVFNVGLHMSLNSADVIDKYVGHIVDMVAEYGNGWPKIVWHDLHSIENFLRSDIHTIFSPWQKYNQEMADYFRKVGIDVLAASQLTKELKSYDFRHFGLGGNMAKVQVLLNYLKTRFEHCNK